MTHQRLAIMVGGGPAPGINSVIAAATIRARLDGVDVLGVHAKSEIAQHRFRTFNRTELLVGDLGEVRDAR